jgi:hypothetical protein
LISIGSTFQKSLLDAGLGEYFRDDAVCLVEWPQKAAGQVPAADIVLMLPYLREPGRTLDVVASTEEGTKMSERAEERLAGRRRLIKFAGASLFLTVSPGIASV